MNKNQHDISQIFLVYMTLVGDAEKTALALDLDPKFVGELAQKEGWADKVRRISLMSKTGTPGDWERAQNRALNFVQCHQLRRTIDNVVHWLATQSAVEVLTTTVDRGVVKFSARLLADLANSMEKIHAMTYAALGDTVKERTERSGGESNPVQSAGLHSALISALNHSSLTLQKPEDVVRSAADEITQRLVSANPSAKASPPDASR